MTTNKATQKKVKAEKKKQNTLRRKWGLWNSVGLVSLAAGAASLSHAPEVHKAADFIFSGDFTDVSNYELSDEDIAQVREYEALSPAEKYYSAGEYSSNHAYLVFGGLAFLLGLQIIGRRNQTPFEKQKIKELADLLEASGIQKEHIAELQKERDELAKEKSELELALASEKEVHAADVENTKAIYEETLAQSPATQQQANQIIAILEELAERAPGIDDAQMAEIKDGIEALKSVAPTSEAKETDVACVTETKEPESAPPAAEGQEASLTAQNAQQKLDAMISKINDHLANLTGAIASEWTLGDSTKGHYKKVVPELERQVDLLSKVPVEKLTSTEFDNVSNALLNVSNLASRLVSDTGGGSGAPKTVAELREFRKNQQHFATLTRDIAKINFKDPVGTVKQPAQTEADEPAPETVRGRIQALHSLVQDELAKINQTLSGTSSESDLKATIDESLKAVIEAMKSIKTLDADAVATAVVKKQAELEVQSEFSKLEEEFVKQDKALNQGLSNINSCLSSLGNYTSQEFYEKAQQLVQILDSAIRNIQAKGVHDISTSDVENLSDAYLDFKEYIVEKNNEYQSSGYAKEYAKKIQNELSGLNNCFKEWGRVLYQRRLKPDNANLIRFTVSKGVPQPAAAPQG